MAPAKSLTLLAALLAAATLHAQSDPVQFTDPANLRGERVKPRDGRELPIDQGARGLEQMLRRLNTRASLMLIVAHPDDEDGGMLTYYSRGLGARVAVLTLTRGEGGQNAMTGDFEDALGLLRTQELLSADRYLGVDQFFGTEVDFGFSKTKEEAFAKWTHERVLYDAVRSIRLYRPLVIAAVFIGGVTDGHGQHQVSGQIAQEAFKAAADPAVFPDMIAEGILPWQALKVYARVPSYSISDKGLFDYATGKYTAPRFENYVTGEVTTTVPSSDVIVHEGTTDPILSDNPSDPPRTYVQFARIGLGLQRSQVGSGMRVPPAGAFDVAYHLYGSALGASSGFEKATSVPLNKSRHPERSEGSATPPVPARPTEPFSHNPESASFFDGIDTSIDGIASLSPQPPDFLAPALATIHKEIDQATVAVAEFRKEKPEYLSLDDRVRPMIGTQLAAILQQMDAVIAQVEDANFAGRDDILHELRVKRVQLNDALLDLLGLRLKSGDSGHFRFAEEPLDLTPALIQGYPAEIKYLRSWSTNSLGVGVATSRTDLSDSLLALRHPINVPCRLTNKQTPVTRPYFIRDSIERPVYRLSIPELRNAPVTPPALTCWSEVEYRGAALQVGATLTKEIVPAVSVHLYDKAEVLPTGERSFPVRGSIEPQKVKLDSLTLSPLDGLMTTQTESFGTYFQYRVDTKQQLPRATELTATATLAGRSYAEGSRAIGYPGVDYTNYYTPATIKIVPVDLKLPEHRRIAFIPGTGDNVEQVLITLGIQADGLKPGQSPSGFTVGDLTPADLSQYDTIILGVRTYSAHPDLHGARTQALLDYARNGGNVLVQYQTAEFTAADAPYPLTFGSAAEKVVDETDPVQLLQPDAPFLTTPNKITPTDFNNWVEERGHGFLSTWDPHYTALTETHDPDQDPQRGGLITTNIGKGRWTYCAFALYRQLPEAVPGAFRLFVNLLNSASTR